MAVLIHWEHPFQGIANVMLLEPTIEKPVRKSFYKFV